jgi:hypothetical protein
LDEINDDGGWGNEMVEWWIMVVVWLVQETGVLLSSNGE